MSQFRRVVAQEKRLLAVVKADAYGHGLLLASRAFLAGGADQLGVHSLAEARTLRAGNVTAPILILGPLFGTEFTEASHLDAEVTIASVAAATEAVQAGVPLKAHLKVETGVNRQGVHEEELGVFLEVIARAGEIQLVGLSSHFSDIEDTTDHTFAHQQMARYQGYQEALVAAGHENLVQHMSCSAAVLLWDRTHGGLARVGISGYGLWPSRETLVAVRQRGRQEIELKRALTWKCRVAQIKLVQAQETVGYGRIWKAMTDSRIAVLPVGFADGWPRALSGRAHVLIQGRRAPLVGRICMNLCMADVTNIPEAAAGDQAVLLGQQGDEEITAESLAAHLGTISYEILTLPGPTWHRQG